ncbi:MAG: methylmalonyl-CoA mutase [Kordiimonadaceae bacterium]|jgi:methylmalonyl-CoA mutase, C-terminal domain|nr:methylmalonyl-CoA mutase [Kordiimonadaceae bacterium]MBT6032595.1 methylmalonyl-CoA mutase [Kordiimonadaceae bacterium]
MTNNNLKYPPRVLVTKIGLDGHDRGSRIVAAYLRDAGMEVIYTPPWQEINAVVNLALQEDIDVIGLSSLATDHLIAPDLMIALRDAGLDHIKVIVGGIVPANEHGMLEDAGISKIFEPGALREDIVESVATLAANARSSRRDFEEASL